jgi:peptidoglycan-N-acetylglucosamine deacetylase
MALKMTYWVKTPKWLKKFYPGDLIWDLEHAMDQAVYLTFDDGPHPKATQFVLDQLQQNNAKATFFCVGKNVVEHPEIYNRILAEGHHVGNHTQNHLNGWKVLNRAYLSNIIKASAHIKSRIFRPPYGRIKISQARKLSSLKPAWKIYMWDILSGDFDMQISPQQCLENVIQHLQPGSIVVFHDSEKAWERMSFALPAILSYCQTKNWALKALPA